MVRRVGVVLLSVGVLLAGFALYLTFATSLVQHNTQRQLTGQIRTALPTTLARAAAGALNAPSGPAAPGEQLAPAPDGAWVGVIEIPTIGVRQVVVEGTGFRDLQAGPGHYPATATLGSRGNAAIAGHRTTWGGPFRDLNRLRRGDAIVVTTALGRYLYVVSNLRDVPPTDVAVLAPTSAPTVTLTTCDPPFTATRRLVVSATMRASEPFAPSAIEHGSADSVNPSLGERWWPVALSITVLGLIAGLGGRWWSRSQHRRAVGSLLVVAVVLGALAVFRALAEVVPSSW